MSLPCLCKWGEGQEKGKGEGKEEKGEGREEKEEGGEGEGEGLRDETPYI